MTDQSPKTPAGPPLSGAPGSGLWDDLDMMPIVIAVWLMFIWWLILACMIFWPGVLLLVALAAWCEVFPNKDYTTPVV